MSPGPTDPARRPCFACSPDTWFRRRGASIGQHDRSASDRDAYHRSFSYLAHSDALKPELTAGENLAFEVGLRRRLAIDEIEAALSRVGLIASRNRPAAVLSAGQRRRLAMARVLLTAAPLWLLDEPFTNLDSEGVDLVSAIIATHLDRGGAAIMAAHQPPAIRNHACRRLELAQ